VLFLLVGFTSSCEKKIYMQRNCFFSVSPYSPPQRLALLSFFCYNVRFEQGNDNDADNNGGGASAD
jgi:hypothetical protein